MDIMKILAATRSCFVAKPIPNLILLCHHDSKNGISDKSDDYPEEPTTCCMTGCANCVWLEYAEKLSRYYQDGGEEAAKQINKRVTDPNMKAFLLHELRMKKQQS